MLDIHTVSFLNHALPGLSHVYIQIVCSSLETYNQHPLQWAFSIYFQFRSNSSTRKQKKTEATGLVLVVAVAFGKETQFVSKAAHFRPVAAAACPSKGRSYTQN